MILFSKTRNICVAALIMMLAACTPEVDMPGKISMDISVTQSYVDGGLKAKWEIGDSVSVFFDGIKTPKYFTVKSVGSNSEEAVITGDCPYGIEDGTIITAVYPHTAISADVSSVPVDISKLKYKDGSIDMSSMIYSAKAIYSRNKITTLGFNAVTSKIAIEITPFEGFDMSKLDRVDVISNDITTKANLNLMAAEGSEPWALRQTGGLSVEIKGVTNTVSRAENGNIKIELICIPTEVSKVIKDFSVFLTSGEEKYYAEVKANFAINSNTVVNTVDPAELNDAEQSIGKTFEIFKEKLQNKKLTSGAIYDLDSKFLGYYNINLDESKEINIKELSSESYSKGDKVTTTKVTYDTGFFTINFSEPKCGVKGFEYDMSSDEVKVIPEEHSLASHISSNAGSAEDFYKGKGAHYEIKIDRTSTESPKFTKGAMSKLFWDGVMAQGKIEVLELNTSRNWQLVTYPNHYTSYKIEYDAKGEYISSKWTGEFEGTYNVDKDLNNEKLGDNILKYYANKETPQKALCVRYMDGKYSFLLIYDDGQWFHFAAE